MKEYTLSIIRSHEKKYVFVKKRKIDNLIGKLVFPGGKIENGEYSSKANLREVEEELEIVTNESDWHNVAILDFISYRLHVFLLLDSPILSLPDVTDTGEEIIQLEKSEFDSNNVDGLCYSLVMELVEKL